ncbi:hypothetical protein M3Y95_00396500 [Aphelenchoides besseyi]|nr:hypothetical protein M3Y95_00396500 [Aphelenchoides besseyi]
MQSVSIFDDPKVAVWQVDNFAELYEKAMEDDYWASEPMAFEHPEVGEIEFHLSYRPKSIADPSRDLFFMQITKAPTDFSISMKCDAWMETVDKKQSEVKSKIFSFDTKSRCYYLSSFSSSQQESMSLLHLPTVFFCCRLPYVVKSIGSIPTKSTLYRWPIADFESRFNSVQFGTKWESDEGVVSGLNGVKFKLEMYPKGENEEHKDYCALYLHVTDLAGLPNVRVQFDLWIENSESRCRTIGFNYDYSTVGGHGTPSYLPQEKLCTFAQKGPFEVCCDVRLIGDPLPIAHCTSFHSEIASFFNDPDFSDTEIHVDNRTFKVSRVIISAHSPVFRAMFTHASKERESGVVVIENFKAPLIEAMLSYMYKNQVMNLKEIAIELLTVANFYQVHSLVKKCTDSILANLSIDNVFASLKVAFELDHLKQFNDSVLKFAHDNSDKMCKLDQFDDFMTEHPEIMLKLFKMSHA